MFKNKNIKVYLVGGAVRDQLLNRRVIDKDYVVVGATPQDMLDANFQQVGSDFPVFLHPQSQEEYALARTERKQGKGYGGFSCDSSPHITLEQDLARRDLTVNAMAQDDVGNIIDPFNGQQDLQDKILRHVSPAFAEDPLRTLRVARFAARFHPLGFSVADDTLALMRYIANQGEISHLTKERVWKETSRALLEPSPFTYLKVLQQADSLSQWFEEIDMQLLSSSGKPVIEEFLHILHLARAPLAWRVAALLHNSHEEQAKKLCCRLHMPKDIQEFAQHFLAFRGLSNWHEVSPEQLLSLLNSTDVWRKPDRFISLVGLWKVHLSMQKKALNGAEILLALLPLLLGIDVKAIVASGKKGLEIKACLQEQRLNIIGTML